MKTLPSTSKGSEASILLVTLCTTAIIGLALVAYLQLVINQNQLVTRSQVWNICMPVLEAGIEEALAHCNANYQTNMVSNGWSLSGSTYRLTNWLDDCYYEVTISTNLPYEIISTGYCPMAGKSGFASRTVKVTTVAPGLFSSALVFLDSLDLKGNNVKVDSYDSTDAAKSTLGRYDPLKAGDKGDVSCKGGVKDELKVGNANIWGHLTTGATAEAYTGPNGAVGDVAWQTGGNSGILSNWWSNDLNVTLPDIKPPFSAAPPAGGGKVSGVSYNYILGNGNYMLPKLDGPTIVTGNAVLYVTDTIKFGNGESVIIMPGASLTLYYAGTDATFNTIVNQNSNPNTFQYYGLSSNNGVLGISGANDITGVIYAPRARVQLTGTATIYGSVAAKEGKLNGSATIHYDESLRSLPRIRGVFANSWREI
jgi:hypothetical protein